MSKGEAWSACLNQLHKMNNLLSKKYSSPIYIVFGPKRHESSCDNTARRVKHLDNGLTFMPVPCTSVIFFIYFFLCLDHRLRWVFLNSTSNATHWQISDIERWLCICDGTRRWRTNHRKCWKNIWASYKSKEPPTPHQRRHILGAYHGKHSQHTSTRSYYKGKQYEFLNLTNQILRKIMLSSD